MSIEQILQNEIEESKRWIDREKDESTYKRDFKKRVELINWVKDNMKNPDIFICEIMESKNDVIMKIKQTHDICLKPINCTVN